MRFGVDRYPKPTPKLHAEGSSEHKGVTCRAQFLKPGPERRVQFRWKCLEDPSPDVGCREAERDNFQDVSTAVGVSFRYLENIGKYFF